MKRIAIVMSTCVLTACTGFDEARLTREFDAAVGQAACVSARNVSFDVIADYHGSLWVRVEVPDQACFEQVMATVARGLRDVGDPTSVRLIGVLPDGRAVTPEAFGLPPGDLMRRTLVERFTDGDE